MKKAISILIIISFLFALSSCKEEKPKISEQHYQYGKKAVEIADQFLNYEISTEKACSLIKALITEEENLPVADASNDTYSSNFIIENRVGLLDSYLLLFKINNSSDEYFLKIYEHRNKIAETIGEDTIKKVSYNIDRQLFADRFNNYSSENWCELAADDSYIIIDTNFFDFDDYCDDNALRAIKEINKNLGFPESTYKKMLQTRSLDGRQQEENEKFIVSWTYHPDTGLEVMYERK